VTFNECDDCWPDCVECCSWRLIVEPQPGCNTCYWEAYGCYTQSPVLVDVLNLGSPDLLAGEGAWRKSHDFIFDAGSSLRVFRFQDGAKYVEWMGGRTPVLVYHPTGRPLGRLTHADLVGDRMAGQVWSNGYEALGSLDHDRNGTVSGVELSSLYLWFDRNTDAEVQEDEVDPASVWVSQLSYQVEPDEFGDVSLMAGAQLLSGEWVRSWDWWMNVWNYPLYARRVDRGSGYSKNEGEGFTVLFPHLERVSSHRTPVSVYEWKIVKYLSQGGKGTSGVLRLISDPSNPDVLIVLLQEGPGYAGDAFVTTAVVGSRVGNTLKWTASPETTEVTVLSDGTLWGTTRSFFAEYQWEARPMDSPTSHPIAGLSDDYIISLSGVLFASDRLDPNGNGHLLLRGALSDPVLVAPLP
jgi:hypothetical protein